MGIQQDPIVYYRIQFRCTMGASLSYPCKRWGETHFTTTVTTHIWGRLCHLSITLQIMGEAKMSPSMQEKSTCFRSRTIRDILFNITASNGGRLGFNNLLTPREILMLTVGWESLHNAAVIRLNEWCARWKVQPRRYELDLILSKNRWSNIYKAG